ncbi:hypothetical protein UlMin_033223 [Ulmus minor]
MVRGKIQMKKIENASGMQVTFSKTRNGLLKKAHELSVRCNVKVAAIIFSQKGKLYEFASIDKDFAKIIFSFSREKRKIESSVITCNFESFLSCFC